MKEKGKFYLWQKKEKRKEKKNYGTTIEHKKVWPE
jgi:hypothetical protein